MCVQYALHTIDDSGVQGRKRVGSRLVMDSVRSRTPHNSFANNPIPFVVGPSFSTLIIKVSSKFAALWVKHVQQGGG